MKTQREEYTLSNEDFKFPTFYDKSLNEIFKKEKMSKEILLNDISNIINHLQLIIDLLTNMIKNNINNLKIYVYPII